MSSSSYATVYLLLLRRYVASCNLTLRIKRAGGCPGYFYLCIRKVRAWLFLFLIYSIDCVNPVTSIPSTAPADRVLHYRQIPFPVCEMHQIGSALPNSPDKFPWWMLPRTSKTYPWTGHFNNSLPALGDETSTWVFSRGFWTFGIDLWHLVCLVQ